MIMQSETPLKLNFSTCPNDTFMFCAMVNRLVETKGYQFEPYLADIEELNRLAAQQLPDITKLSYGAYPELASSYQLLDSGSALGSGVGPLVVSKRKIFPMRLPTLEWPSQASIPQHTYFSTWPTQMQHTNPSTCFPISCRLCLTTKWTWVSLSMNHDLHIWTRG